MRLQHACCARVDDGLLIVADFESNAVLIEEAVRTKEPRSIVRALRNLVSIRSRLSAEFLADAVLVLLLQKSVR